MLKQIVDVVNKIRKEYPIIGNELDGKIYYMNGNDGTAFDWNCNERVCEFMVFHENEMGYIKLMVYKDNTMRAYIYADGGMHPTDEKEFTYNGNTITNTYGKNQPVRGGYFAGYVNGKQNIVGQRLFIEV